MHWTVTVLFSRFDSHSKLQGFEVAEGGGIHLISEVIRGELNIPCAVLMGANIANEVAHENYCEATIGKYSAKVCP